MLRVWNVTLVIVTFFLTIVGTFITRSGVVQSVHAFGEDPELARYSGFVDDSGEGRWTIMAAIEEAVPAEVLSAALYARFRSREDESFANKLLSAMRNKFGGHVEVKGAESKITVVHK